MEYTFLDWIWKLHNPTLDHFFTVVTKLGDASIIWILAIFYLYFSDGKKKRKLAVCALLALMISVAVGTFLKYAFHRQRPFTLRDINLLIAIPWGFSFPSGHTYSSFAVSYAIFLKDKKFGRVLLALAFLIGFSRLYHYVHYPSDVFFGIVLGIASAYGAHRLVYGHDFLKFFYGGNDEV